MLGRMPASSLINKKRKGMERRNQIPVCRMDDFMGDLMID
jgi:hypothetical protein